MQDFKSLKSWERGRVGAQLGTIEASCRRDRASPGAAELLAAAEACKIAKVVPDFRDELSKVEAHENPESLWRTCAKEPLQVSYT